VSYKLYDVAQGSFAVDWDTCCQIIRSHYRADFQSKYAEEKTESQSSTLNPLSWGLPDLTFIVVDWNRVRTEAQSNVLLAAHKLAALAVFQSSGIDAMVRELKRMQLETRRLNAAFSERMRKASHKSWTAMEQSVATYQSRINEAKLVRDLSGSILIGAATVATGGASAAAIGGMGTVVKTTAKYQDTGNAGVAALEATQNIVCTVIPGAKQVAMGKAIKTVISTGMDTGKALLEGEPIGTAIAVGAVSIPVAAGGDQANKDYAHAGQQHTMTLRATEFLRRFVQHVLPRGFVRIRQFGFLANACRRARVSLARTLLATPSPAAPSTDATPTVTADTVPRAIWACPRCGAAMIVGPILSPLRLASVTLGFDTS
jgi:Putative transposase